MAKTLIIAEKPSVATDLSRVLTKAPGFSKFEKKGTGRQSYYESENAVITSAVGHLVELKMPLGPNGKGLPWKFDVLPAIPDRFELQASENTEAQLKLVLKLANRKDVDLIVNACDAGREGELIFRYIMEYGDIKKPSKRLWMQSMTPNAILQAWGKLRSEQEMKPLADAAKCRSESDWLIGLNATRSLTAFRSRHGGFNITAAGRVQTPTLAILAKRESEIQTFVPTNFWEVEADFSVKAGSYSAKWFDPNYDKSSHSDPNLTGNHLRDTRLWKEEDAKAIVERCTGKKGIVTEETKPQTQSAPLLYDLTSLQREAPFSAKQTLQIAQALYEKHKVLTYPRTDSRYLPEDYLGTIKETLQAVSKEGAALSSFASDILNNRNGAALVKSKRVFDDKKVSDHFAIIPTGKFANLSDAEQKLFDMVLKRFLAVFHPAAEFTTTKRITTISHGSQNDLFKTEGRILVKPGWLAVYGRKPGVAADKDELCAVSNGESANAERIELMADVTRPPARYTEATLLSAMESAGKLIDDEELREAMSERGLGTPATRAAIIEGLIYQKYLARDGRDLIVTGKGQRLIELLEEMNIDGLASPSMTGEWEYKLRQMEQGKLARQQFMGDIITYTEDIVKRAKSHMQSMVARSFPDLSCACPNCGAPALKVTDATYECREPDCDFKISRHIAGRELTSEDAKQLFSTKFLDEREGYMSRFNKPFAAALKLDRTVSKTGKLGKWKTDFVFEGDEEVSTEELSEEQVIGSFVREEEDHKIYELDKAYYIPSLKTKKNPDGVKVSKRLLAHEVTPQEVLTIMKGDKTPKIDDFVSNRTKRKFSAFLIYDFKEERPSFEFPPRAAKKAKKAE